MFLNRWSSLSHRLHPRQAHIYRMLPALLKYSPRLSLTELHCIRLAVYGSAIATLEQIYITYITIIVAAPNVLEAYVFGTGICH
jgi:hypothetical protein